MRRRLARSGRGGVGATLLAAACLAQAGPAGAVPPPPAELRVEGGEEGWHWQRGFRLLWRIPSSGGGPAVAAVRYRVLDPAGAVAVGPARIDWPAMSLEDLEVPDSPGAYTAEVRLEDADGAVGAPASAMLRFDDERPGDVQPLVADSWIGRTAFPLNVRLAPPDGEPTSGIRGYAVSVAPPPGRPPCLLPQRCSEAETDLHGGIADDTYRIADLPAGISQLQALAVSGSGMASATLGLATLRVDKTSPTVALEGVSEGWASHPVSVTATARDGGSGMAAEGAGPAPFTAIAIDAAAPVVAAGTTVSTTVVGEGVHRIAYYARDLAGNVDDGGESNGLANPQPTTALVRIDRRPPSVAFANSQIASEPETIRAWLHDSLSGGDASRGWIGVRRAGSGDRFAPLPPLPPLGGELRARWDSDSHPAGSYEFRAVGYDVAGNATATTRRASGTLMLLANPLKAGTSLAAGLGGGDSLRQIASYGRAGRLRGSLTTGVRTPLAHRPVRIVERFSRSAGLPGRVSTVWTDPDGAFALRLAAGPSREVTAFFDGTPTLSGSSSHPLGLAVRSAVGLHVSSPLARIGGRPIVFRGRVAGVAATLPSDGKSVQLQFRLPGLPWREFRTIRTDRHGRFRYAYRFSDDDSRGVRFQFRAYAPAQAGWPYEPAGSRPVTVRGT